MVKIFTLDFLEELFCISFFRQIIIILKSFVQIRLINILNYFHRIKFANILLVIALARNINQIQVILNVLFRSCLKIIKGLFAIVLRFIFINQGDLF